MKKLIFILTFFVLPFILLGQEESFIFSETNEEIGSKHEVGINVTSFIKRLISFNDSQIFDNNSYLLSYTYLISQKRSLRFGINADYIKADEDIVNSIGGDDSKFYRFDFRMGYVLNRKITKRWSTYLGFDIVYGLDHNETSISNTFEPFVIRTTNSKVGGGPALGIQFYINPKISISTEMSFYYKYVEKQEERDFNGSGFPDVVNNTKGSNVNLTSPASLYFNFRF